MSEKIDIAVGGVLNFLKGVPLCASTVSAYQSCYKILRTYCENGGISQFTIQDADIFTDSQIPRRESGEISVSYYRNLRKAAVLLADYMQGNELTWRRRDYKSPILAECFYNSLTSFSAHISHKLSDKSVRFSSIVAKQFLVFLEKNDIHDFMALSEED